MDYLKTTPDYDKLGSMKEKVDAIEYEIAYNLAAVHNKISSKHIKVKNVFSIPMYVDVEPQNAIKIGPFADLCLEFVSAYHGRDQGFQNPMEVIFDDYTKLRDKLADQMRNI